MYNKNHIVEAKLDTKMVLHQRGDATDKSEQVWAHTWAPLHDFPQAWRPHPYKLLHVDSSTQCSLAKWKSKPQDYIILVIITEFQK